MRDQYNAIAVPHRGPVQNHRGPLSETSTKPSQSLIGDQNKIIAVSYRDQHKPIAVPYLDQCKPIGVPYQGPVQNHRSPLSAISTKALQSLKGTSTNPSESPIIAVVYRGTNANHYSPLSRTSTNASQSLVGDQHKYIVVLY